jgi:hypothetical protein
MTFFSKSIYMTYVMFVERYKMRQIHTFLILLFTITLGTVLPVVNVPQLLADTSSTNLIIEGLVSNPLNLTYAEIESFPQVSEIALLQCVWAPSGAPFNWTGVPLFYLLNLANVKSGAKKVVFRATDGFSSSLTTDNAMYPTTLLALRVNGSVLSDTEPLTNGSLPAGYPYKVVVPCKHGYKWVGWIQEIEVVDYDYLGTYESQGFSDDASIPNCTRLPELELPYSMLNVTLQANLNVTIFSQCAVSYAVYNQTTRRIQLLVTAENQNDFVYLIVPKKFLYPTFVIFLDGTLVQCNAIQSQTNSFIYFATNPGTQSTEIKGALPADVTGPNAVSDGRVDLRDIGYVARRFMSNHNDPLWGSRVDLNFDDKIDMQDVAVIARDFGIIY